MQAAQVLVEAQIGTVPLQVALVRQPTHVLVEVSHTESVAEQSVFAVHCTHAPMVEQSGCPGSLAAHSALDAHVVHVPAKQTGVAAGQVVLSKQPTQVPAGEQSVRDGSLRSAHLAFDAQAAQTPAEQI